jgi:hypothetical protein
LVIISNYQPVLVYNYFPVYSFHLFCTPRVPLLAVGVDASRECCTDWKYAYHYAKDDDLTCLICR